MSTLDQARLSAIAAAVDDATARVTELIESVGPTAVGDLGGALFEAERSLTMARRAMARALRAIDAS